MKTGITLLFLYFSLPLFAQSTYAPLDQDYYHLVDRIDLLNKNFSPLLHTTDKPYMRSNIVLAVDSAHYLSSKQDLFNAHYLKVDSWTRGDEALAKSKKPMLKYFYRTQSDFLHLNTPFFLLKVNPILYLGIGRDSNSQSMPFVNTRGVQVRGMIDQKVGFYSSIEESQAVFPQYVQDYIATRGVVPGEAFWKKYQAHGVDFFTARGYFTFHATRHIGVQFGHDKNFIGQGYRSLFLSDFAAPSTFLKIQTNVWRIQYTNLYTELVADTPFTSFGSNGVKAFPKKFMTAHHLSINLSENFNLGFYEAVVFHRGDSTGSAFEWSYLNPIIFYRAIEQYNGSPDNAVFGIDFKWNIAKGVQLYGQGLLDEIVLSKLTDRSGWWGNKFAVQLGMKYYNVLKVDNLDLQVEFNLARPFNYAHRSIFTSFTHYRMPLAHPLGANFREWIGRVKYQSLSRWFLSAQFIAAQYGADTAGKNYGGDPLKSYDNRVRAYGNFIGQGVAQRLLYVDFTASYMLFHNFFIDLRQWYRRQSRADAPHANVTHFTTLSLRLNIAKRTQAF